MNQPEQFSSDRFVAVAQGKERNGSAPRLSGNVMKDVPFEKASFRAIVRDSACTEEPAVSIQRSGDIVTGIEFRCSCGRSKIVSFEYEDE